MFGMRKKYTNKVILCSFFFFLLIKKYINSEFSKRGYKYLIDFFFMRCSYFWNQAIKEYIFTFDRLKTNNGTYQKKHLHGKFNNALIKKKRNLDLFEF